MHEDKMRRVRHHHHHTVYKTYSLANTYRMRRICHDARRAGIKILRRISSSISTCSEQEILILRCCSAAKKKTIGFQPHFNINWLRERNICDDRVSYCSTYIYIYVVHAEGSGQHYWRTTGANWIRPLLQCQQLKSICIALLRWLESRTQIKCKIILSIGWRKGWVALRLSAACVGVVRKVDALTIVRCWCVRMADVGCGEQHCHVTRSNMQAATGNQLNSRREYPPQPAWPSNSLSNRKLCRKSVALNIITTNESSIKWTQIICQTQSETSFHQNFANERLNWIIVSHECVSDQHRHCNKKYQNIEHAETDTNGGEHSQKFNEWMKHNDYARNKNFSFA